MARKAQVKRHVKRKTKTATTEATRSKASTRKAKAPRSKAPRSKAPRSKASKAAARARVRAAMPSKPVGRAAKRLSVEGSLKELRRRLLEISDLNAAGSVLSWDQATYMPNGGAAARGRQGATLRRLAHEMWVDPALGRLIDAIEPAADRLSDDDSSLIRVVRRDFDKAIKVPAEHVARANALGSASYDA